MAASEAKSILHCPDAYGGIYGEKYGQAIAVAFKSLEAWEKIRAEIAGLDDADYDYEGYYKAVTDAVKIIDKYKAESEVQDADSD